MAEVLVRAEELGKTYGAVVPTVALRDVSFELHAREFASLIGQSGSGKSTLLNLIGLLDTPTTGRIVLNGHDTSGADRKRRATLRGDFLGFVFQFHYLLPEFSVLENVVMPGRIAGASMGGLLPRARETLEMLGLEGLEEKNANDLSGGQKQRVAIARALMNRPALVLADEPTGNLDTENTQTVYRLFRQINEELRTAFLIVTHDRAVAQQTDRILEISDGRLVQDVPNEYLPRLGPDDEPVEEPGESHPETEQRVETEQAEAGVETEQAEAGVETEQAEDGAETRAEHGAAATAEPGGRESVTEDGTRADAPE